MTGRIRAFAALLVPTEALAACIRVQEALRHGFPRSERPRWARPEQMHLTVRFLGGVSSEDVETARELVVRAALGSRPFACPMRPPDAFPSPRRGRVIVVPFASVPVLDHLAQTLQVAFARLGVPADERAFSPHVTLARLRRPMDVRSHVARCEVEPTLVKFERLVLFRSDLEPTGARYTPLVAVPLGTDNFGRADQRE